MKSWKFALVAFLAGALLGGWTLQVLHTQLDRPPEPVGAPAGSVSIDAHLVRDLQSRLDSQSAEISRLQGMIRNMETEPAPPPPPEEVVEAPPQEEERPPRRGFDRFINRRVDELADSLGLTDDQRGQLEAIFQAQFENMRARRRGEEVEAYNLDDALATVLTPEQFDEYIESSQQEIYNRAELMATTQVVRLNQMVELTPEQMDQVYETFNYSFQEMMIARQTGEDFNGQVLMDKLGSILTEEQMARFQEEGSPLGPGPGRFGP